MVFPRDLPLNKLPRVDGGECCPKLCFVADALRNRARGCLDTELNSLTMAGIVEYQRSVSELR